MAVREYRERIDIAQLTNDDLYKRYRVNHATLAYIIAQLDAALAPYNDRSHSLSTGYKVLITLRYLATGVIQLNTGDHKESQTIKGLKSTIIQLNGSVCKKKVKQ
ncbi:hypothetical protein DPMN_043070 [Dreissena polymorpha]|uniref:Uncharacterized protein n=1 Tax=Dreissena polymorpha TaxID=45954 RepID=A0A9D4D0N2_DREPO|nr:hypothetical protein DPMN_043070 [Dreissena polymorpha]